MNYFSKPQLFIRAQEVEVYEIQCSRTPIVNVFNSDEKVDSVFVISHVRFSKFVQF